MTSPVPPPGAPAPAAQRCYRHPGRETYVHCVRCERPICPDCMRPASVGFQCPDDARAGARSIRAPRTTVGARILDAPPWATIGLIAANVVVYIVSGLQRGATLLDPSGSALFRAWALFPPAIHQDGDYYQLLTSAFLHLSVLHIAANMISLAIIGPAVERLLGWWRFLAVYLICAVGGGVAVYAFGSPFGYTAGASGAIFGLFGLSLILVRRLGLDMQWLIGVIVLNLVVTFAVPGISILGHLGGLVTGGLAGLVLGGPPRASHRVPVAVQGAGLVGLVVLEIVITAVRTAVF